MTNFAFRLEKVLRWRQARLELEQFALSRLAAECAHWDEVLAKLSQARTDAQTLMRSSETVNGLDLAALGRYQQHLDQQRTAAFERRRECGQRMEQQRGRLLQARRDHRLLEKLRQTRHAEWETAVNREFEALSAENYLARWVPRMRSHPEP